MSINHLPPQSFLPGLQEKTVNTTTWGAGGNTCTIVDSTIHPNSQVDIWVTGSTPQTGNWALAITQGKVVITSGSSEQSSLTFSYLVF